MANDREPDIGQLWRQQPQEKPTMTLEEIRTKARDLDERVSRWRLVGSFTFAVLIIKTAWEVWIDTDVLERGGDALMFAALLYIVYRFSRHARAHTAPATLGRASCLDHYRAQRVRQHELSREGWKYILPFAPGMGLIVFGRALQGRPPEQVVLLIVLALLMFGGVLWVIARGTRRLEREIAALESE